MGNWSANQSLVCDLVSRCRAEMLDFWAAAKSEQRSSAARVEV
jgi:hypothetical protein